MSVPRTSIERFIQEIVHTAAFTAARHNDYIGTFLGKVHQHADLYQFSYVLEGQTPVLIGKHHYAAGEGSLLMIPPCHRHASGPGDEPKRFKLLQLKFALKHQLPLPFPVYIRLGHSADISAVFHSIINEFHMQRPQRETMMRLDLARLVGLIFRYHSLKGINYHLPLPADHLRMEQCVEKVMRYIQSNYSRRLTLPAMARANGYSVSRLSHTFKQSAGISPIRYLINYRLSKALDLMEKTEKKLEDIAFETGFSSGHYFSRLFRMRYHQSPRRYARLVYNVR